MLDKVPLKNTDLSVSRICLGTNMFGTAVEQSLANALLDRFVELGGNFIDTARMYGDWVPTAPKGASERAVGAWLKTRARDQIVLATKGCAVDLRAGAPKPRVTPDALQSDLMESLAHLGVSKIDLYWLHFDDPSQPVAPIMDALISHQKAGRIGWFGASNWAAARIEEANRYAASKGHSGFVATQPFWGLAEPNREAAQAQGYILYYEDNVRPLHAKGFPVVAYSGQSRGFFSKLAKGEAAIPDHLKAIYLNEANRRRLTRIKSLTEKYNASINQIVLAYLLCQPNPTIPIIGASGVDQVSDSVKAHEIKLSRDEIELLRSAQ